MKRAFIMLLFGLLGLAFEWGMPFLMASVWPSEAMQRHGEDEVGRQLKVYILCGGGLFFALFAWSGYVFAANKRKAVWMAIGILLGTIAAIAANRLLPSRLYMFDDWLTLLMHIIAWATVCAAFAYLMGRLQSEQ